MSRGQAQYRRSAVVPRLAFLMGLALVASPSVPHSSWPAYHSAKSALSLDLEGLRAVVVLEVPTFEMVTRFREHFRHLDLMKEIENGRFDPLEDEFREAQLARFAAGLELYLNHEPARGAWKPVKTPVNGKGTDGFFIYMLEFVFEPASAAPNVELIDKLDVRLVNRCSEDKTVVLANLAEVGDGWEIVASSIPPPEEYPEVPEGAVLSAEIGLWTMDAEKRDLRISFARLSANAE